METQREEKEENGSVKNQEEVMLSTRDSKLAAEEIVKRESRGGIQLDYKPLMEDASIILNKTV